MLFKHKELISLLITYIFILARLAEGLMMAAHEWASLLGFILLIGSQESFWPLTLHCLWTELFYRHYSESCLNEKYSLALACLLWESCAARQQGCCKGEQ